MIYDILLSLLYVYLASVFITQMETNLHLDRYRSSKGVKYTTLGHEDFKLDLALNLYPVVNTMIAAEIVSIITFSSEDSRVMLEELRRDVRTELAKALNGDDEK